MNTVVSVASLASASAIASPSSSTPENDADDLWRRWKHAQSCLNDLHHARDAAEHEMPWWARSGRKFLQSDGTLTGEVSGWPAIENADLPTVHLSSMRNIRPDPDDIRGHRQLLGHGARRLQRRDLRNLVIRLRRQKAERERVGIPTIDAQIDRVDDELMIVERAIQVLPPSINTAAMLTLILDGRDDITDCGLLRHLRPSLAGELAQDVDARLAIESA